MTHEKVLLQTVSTLFWFNMFIEQKTWLSTNLKRVTYQNVTLFYLNILNTSKTHILTTRHRCIAVSCRQSISITI